MFRLDLRLGNGLADTLHFGYMVDRIHLPDMLGLEFREVMLATIAQWFGVKVDAVRDVLLVQLYPLAAD